MDYGCRYKPILRGDFLARLHAGAPGKDAVHCQGTLLHAAVHAIARFYLGRYFAGNAHQGAHHLCIHYGFGVGVYLPQKQKHCAPLLLPHAGGYPQPVGAGLYESAARCNINQPQKTQNSL